jgi:hypothetical protein
LRELSLSELWLDVAVVEFAAVVDGALELAFGDEAGEGELIEGFFHRFFSVDFV